MSDPLTDIIDLKIPREREAAVIDVCGAFLSECDDEDAVVRPGSCLEEALWRLVDIQERSARAKVEGAVS